MKFTIESSVWGIKNIAESFKDSTYWLWILLLLPVSAWRNIVNIFPLAVGITDVINLVHIGSRDHSYYSLLFILSFARKNLGLLDSFREEVRPFIETSPLLATCILTSKWFLLAAHFSCQQNLFGQRHGKLASVKFPFDRDTHHNLFPRGSRHPWHHSCSWSEVLLTHNGVCCHDNSDLNITYSIT